MSQNPFEKIMMLGAATALIGGVYLIKTASKDQFIEKPVASFSNPSDTFNNLPSQSSSSSVRPNAKSKENSRQPASPSIDFSKIQSRLLSVETCYLKPGKCGFPQTDPKSEFFAIGKKLRGDLNVLFQMAMEKKIKNDTLSNIARHFLKIPDGHVKEAALHLLSTQDKDLQSMEAILKEIINYHDAKLIQHAMLELQYYLEEPDQAHRIHTALSNAIESGSILVSQEITRHIRPFINARSVSLYTQTLTTLTFGGLSRKRIENAINDFNRSQESA